MFYQNEKTGRKWWLKLWIIGIRRILFLNISRIKKLDNILPLVYVYIKV
jgi:hypothetical protein